MLKRIFLDLYFYLLPIPRLIKSGAKIGKNLFLGKSCYFELENANLLEIGDNVVISAHSRFVLHDSSLNNVSNLDVLYGKIILENNCYIGANTTILPGSRVGENTIVGANSLVKGVLKSNSVYIGSPAKYYCSIKELQTKWQKFKKDKSDLIFFKKQKRWNEN